MRAMFCLCVACAFTLGAATVSAQDAQRLHRDAVVVDGHNDILSRVLKGARMDVRGNTGQSDLPRFGEGALDVQVFSVYVHPSKAGEEGWLAGLAQIDSLRALASRAPERLAIVTDGRGVDEALRRSALAAIIGLEGALLIDGRADRLRALHARGLRVFAPTWNRSSDWATSSADEAKGMAAPGLSTKGRALVRLLDTLGMLLDVSHLGTRSIEDALRETRNPVIASHSSCAALRPHHRNLSDEQLRAIAARGGVVMINFFPPYIRANVDKNTKRALARACKELDALARRFKRSDARFLAAFDAAIDRAARRGIPTLRDVADHIDHAVRVMGAAHVGLGSDFDGIDHAPLGLHDVTWLPLLTRELLRRGHDEEAIRGILGGNFLRVFGHVTAGTSSGNK